MELAAWIDLTLLATALLTAFPLTVIGLSLPERILDWRRLADAPRPLAVLLVLLPVLMAVWASMTVPDLALPGILIMGWSLFILSIVDARVFLLPDCLTLPLIVAGVAHSVLLAVFAGDESSGGFQALVASAMAAAAAYAFMALVAALFRRLRGREGLGLGDAKLFAAAGAWLGLASLPSVLLLGAVGALILTLLLRRGQSQEAMPLPFGPYLAAGIWLTALYGPIAFN